MDVGVRPSSDRGGQRVDRLEEGVDDRIEPGSPRLENVLFVALGILSALAVVAHLVAVFG